MRDDKRKLQVCVRVDIAEKARIYADKMGLSVSNFCAVAIAEKIAQYEKAYDILDRYTDELIKKNLIDEKEVKKENEE